jgi:hypothetical protein
VPASSRRSRTPPRRPANQRLTTGQRWFAAFVAVLSSISSVAGPVWGSVFVENSMEGASNELGAGQELLDYATGTHLTVTGEADWTAGVHNLTAAGTATGGNLQLDHRGDVRPTALPAWWDSTWGVRRCITVTNGGAAETDYPVLITLDTTATVAAGDMLVGGADVRVIDSATGLELPMWVVDDDVPSTASAIWVQLADMPVGASEVCLYSGNTAATTVSDESAIVFTNNPNGLLHYHTLTPSWSGTLSVVSYTANNAITAGNETAGFVTKTAANAGDVVTFTLGIDRNTFVTAEGPISGAGAANPTDALMPESFAATSFVFANNNNVQTIWIRAPFGAPVTLEFESGGAVISTKRVGATGAPATTQTINPTDGVVGVTADAGANQGVMVRAIVGGQFLAAHEGEPPNKKGNTDAIVGVPWLSEAVYGVRTSFLQVVAGQTSAEFTALGSDGTNITSIVNPTAMVTTSLNVAGDRLGNGPAIRVTSNGPAIAAAQSADGNGNETTAFLPYSLLDREYYLPIDASYVAIACPVVGQLITVTPPGGASSNLPCVTSLGAPAGAPGKAYIGTQAAGTRFASTDRFYLMMEKTATGSNEINVFGANAARPQIVAGPTLSLGPLQGLFRPAGTWTSPVYDTGSSSVFGLLEMLSNTRPGTTATVQFASGTTAAAAAVATSVGPDGTSATGYSIGAEAIAGLHDFDQFVHLVVSLRTTDPLVSPTITSVDISSDLSELATANHTQTVIAIDASPGPTSHLISRIHATGTQTYDVEFQYQAGSNLASANLVTIRTDHPADHVRAVAGSIVQGQTLAPFTIAPGQSFSLFLDEDIAAGQTVTLDVMISARETSGVLVQHDLRFELAAP